MDIVDMAIQVEETRKGQSFVLKIAVSTISIVCGGTIPFPLFRDISG
jgi:hypothetical protein